MGVCASKPAHKGEAETNAGTLTPGATATITPSLQGAKSTEQETLEQASGELPIAKDSYGAEEVQKPRSARTSFDARREGTSPAEGAEESRLPEDVTGASISDVDDPQLLKEYTRLAEMLRYSPYPVTLIAIEEDNQPYVFVNNVGNLALCSVVGCRLKSVSPPQQAILLGSLQVFCERLGFTDTDVIGKSWYAPSCPPTTSAALVA